MKETLTKETLEQLFTLDKVTGKLYWKVKPANGAFIGKEAGTLHTATGYRVVKISNKAYKSHRVIWCMLTGSWPKEEIDHTNGVKDDNRPENLREVTRAQNTCNCADYKNNKSGRRGVNWDKNSGKWKAQITLQGKRKHLGLFIDLEEAHEVYKQAAASHNKEYRRML